MRKLLWVLLGGCVLVSWVGASPLATIEYQVTALGNGVERYTYSVENLTLSANEEIDIEFNPKMFGVLSDPQAGNQFSAFVFQPNNPLGAPGDFSVAALSDNTPASGPFSVDFTYTGTGVPGVQSYEINQYDAKGNFEGLLASGTTVPLTNVPEPNSLALAGVALGLCAFCRVSGVKSFVRDLCNRNRFLNS